MTLPAITRVNGGFEVFNKPSSNSDNAFYPPKLTTVQRDAMAAQEGAVVLNSDTNILEVLKDAVWLGLVSTTDINGYTSIAIGAGTPTATAPFNGETHTIGTLYYNSAVPKLWVCSVAGTPGIWLGIVVA